MAKATTLAQLMGVTPPAKKSYEQYRATKQKPKGK
jgi:hypothetical protein